MEISIIIPIYNEVENLSILHNELVNVLDKAGHPYELVFVDDGSQDGSGSRLAELSAQDTHVRIIRFRRNHGQTAALQAGLEWAHGDVIVTMDGDLQNDPADIPQLIESLTNGYDLAHGWRRERKDAWLSRVLPSKIANAIISRATGVTVHDLGCTLKAMRREIADELELYGQMHRFIPILAAERGARCVEVVTHHRARRFGQSKYGISRTLQVLLDLCTVRYMQCYFANPMRLFGKLAVLCGIAGSISMITTLTMKWQAGVDMTGNPLLLLTAFCWLTSTQLMSLGLLGEVAARIYYQRDGNRPFTIAEMQGFPDREAANLERTSSPRAA